MNEQVNREHEIAQLPAVLQKRIRPLAEVKGLESDDVAYSLHCYENGTKIAAYIQTLLAPHYSVRDVQEELRALHDLKDADLEQKIGIRYGTTLVFFSSIRAAGFILLEAPDEYLKLDKVITDNVEKAATTAGPDGPGMAPEDVGGADRIEVWFTEDIRATCPDYYEWRVFRNGTLLAIGRTNGR